MCRTESGLRVHSWGAAAAGRISYPDTTQREIAGQVISVRGNAARMQVLLQTATGEPVAEVQTDATGAFRFSAAPVKVKGMGTFPVRAYALVGGRVSG